MSKKIIDEVLSGLSDKERRYSMHRYEVIIYWSEEDNAYIAEVPELPGCMADGATYDEALKNVQMIIYVWSKNGEIARKRKIYCR